MAALTYYVALPFRRADDGQVVSGEPQECQDSGKAIRVASILAADPANCGAIAFSRSGDPSMGEFEDAIVIRSFGEVDSALT